MRDKRTICFAMVLFASLSGFALTATTNGVTWTYTVSGGAATITGSSRKYGAIEIPSKLGGYNVRCIGIEVFRKSDLTGVTIPDSVTHINTNAFRECYSLSSVTLGSGVETIDNAAFKDCSSLTNVTLPASLTLIHNYVFAGCTSLTEMTVPDKVTYLRPHAFEDCTGLKSVKIGKKVAKISDGCFARCSSLTSVTFTGDAPTYFGTGVFTGVASGCRVYVNRGSTGWGVTIPGTWKGFPIGWVQYIVRFNANGGWCATSEISVECATAIGELPVPTWDNATFVGWFTETEGGTRIEESTVITDDVTLYAHWELHSNVWLYDLKNGEATITKYSSPEGDVLIPEEIDGYPVAAIGTKVFSGCTNLTSITIPDNVKDIGNYAFEDCIGLTSVTIGNGVTNVGNYAFKNCSSLMSVTIGNDVKSIGYSAFNGCTNLTSVTIPDSVTSIGYSAFDGCSNLVSVVVGDGVTSVGSDAFRGTPFYNNLPDGLVVLGKVAYGMRGTCPSVVTIPDGVAIIGNSVFSGCSRMTSVTIPDSVTSVGADAFRGCSGLMSMTISDSVTNIGTSAFYNCNGLTSVTIGNGVTDIGAYAFYNCTNLASVIIPTSVMSIEDWAFYNCKGLTSVTIGNGVTNIGAYAFRNCSSLTSVTIPNGVTGIGSSAFYNCSGLTSVYIDDVAAWCRISFNNSYANPLYCAHNLYVNDALVIDLAIPEGVTCIASYAFYNCSGLTSVTIPNSVTSIGSYAFGGCSGLTSMTIGNGVTSIGSYAFYYCSGLTSVTIPSSVTNIGSYAFYNCSGLTSVCIDDVAAWCRISVNGSYANPLYYAHNLYVNDVLVIDLTIPEGVTCIGDDAFSGCSGLTSVAIPDSVTNIGSSAFRGCSGLTGLTIGNGVTDIGADAFYNCTNLTSVTIPDSVTNIGSSAFRGCSGLRSVTIPQYVLDCQIRGVFPSAYGLITNVSYSSIITKIGSSAFSYCSGLTSVAIPDSVTNIGSSAFRGCSCLTEITVGGANTVYKSENGLLLSKDGTTLIQGHNGNVTIPSSVTRIGASAFEGCSGLTEITVGAANTVYKSENGLLLSKDGMTLIQGINGNVTIPDSVTRIGASAFSGCSGLTSVTIPGSVTNFGSSAFRDCSGLTSVYIDDVAAWCRISFNGSYANPLYCAHNLYVNNVLVIDLTIPEGVTYIENYAFPGCSCLTSVTIPNSVTNIGTSAFEGCSGLTEIAVGAANAVYKSEGSLLLSKDGTTLIHGINGNVTIPDSVTRIGASAFSGCSGLKSVTIPNSVTEIGTSAFYGCIGVTSVTIPECVCSSNTFVSIFSSALGQITDVTIADGATKIGDGAFGTSRSSTRRLSRLTSITIPNSVTAIATNAFAYCDKLTSVTIPQCVCNSKLFEVFPSSYQSITNVIIADGVALIISSRRLSALFSGCENMTSMTIPASVTISGLTIPGVWRGIAIDYIRHEVTFDPNGGMDVIAISNIVDGTMLETLPTPTRDDAAFLGWFTDAEGGDEVGAPLTVMASIVLYAHWLPIHKVTFNPNGGACGIVSSNVLDGTVLDVLPTPTYENAFFIGWFTDAEGGEEVVAPLTVAASIALYAHWLEVEPPVVISGGGNPFRTESSEVSIACATGGATIYYADDGTTPKIRDEYLYTGPFTITDTATIKAVAVYGGIKSRYETVTIKKTPLTMEEVLDVGEGVVVETSASFPWRPILDSNAKVGDATARSGEIGNRTNTWLTATVSGAGTMSFWCKVSCEHDDEDLFTCDRLMVYTNGVEITDWRMDGETGWTQRELTFAGGENTVKWVYCKDKSDTAGEDCAWVDGVAWTPAGVNIDVGGEKSVTVPGDWLTNITARIEAAGGDVAAALQTTAANGRLSVVECYVVGLDPEIATNDFKITSFSMKADGTPDLANIAVDPPKSQWNVPGARAVVKGAATLDGEWKAVEGATAAEKAAMRFFKVVVEVQ